MPAAPHTPSRVLSPQGNTAKVSKASAGKGAHTVHVIDKVLYSGA